MSDDSRLETVGQIWDGISTGRRLELLLSLLGMLAGAFGAGYWFANERASSEIAALNVKHERELSDVARKNAPTSASRISLRKPEAGLPSYDDAMPSDLSLLDVESIVKKHEKENAGLTYIQRTSPFSNLVGQRFKWTGFVAEIYPVVYDGVPYFSLYLSPRSQQGGYRQHRDEFEVMFKGEHHEEMIKGLVPNQQITVSGVMSLDGGLVSCKFVHIGDPPADPSETG